MTIKEVTTKTSQMKFPILLDNNNQVVMEVFRYLRNLVLNEYSKNTISLYCYYLKAYYE